MKRHDIRVGEQRVEARNFATGGADCILGNEGIEDQASALERSQPRGDLAADAAETDNADRLIPHRSHLVQGCREPPLPIANQQRIGDNLSRGGKNKCQRVVRNFIDAVVRNIAHGNPTLARRFQIDVVDTDPVPHDGTSTLHGPDHFGVDRSELSDDRIGIGDQRFEDRDFLGVTVAKLHAGLVEDFLLDIENGKRVVGDSNERHENIPVGEETF